jgi:hypothetical protein
MKCLKLIIKRRRIDGDLYLLSGTLNFVDKSGATEYYLTF